MLLWLICFTILIFNQDISKWDISNVTNLESMFNNCKLFNQDISSWNTSKVTNMSYMFRNANSFNTYIQSWNVINVIDFDCMFEFADQFCDKFDADYTPDQEFFTEFIDDQVIRIAVDKWFTDRFSCIEKFGNIQNWDTS